MNIHNLDLSNEFWRNELPEDANIRFVQFVNRVLLLHDGELLNKFHLVWWPRCIPSQLCSWITTAITKNVHELNLIVRPTTDLVELPISLFSCDSLQSFELVGTISVSSAIVVSLPRLETLKLESVFFESEEAFENLICGCPMLSYLHLHIGMHENASYSDDLKYIISSASLRRLELRVKYSDDYYPPRLHLQASSLEYLKLGGFISQVCVRGSLSSLVEADFKIQFLYGELPEDDYNSVVEAVRAFDCAKVLTLGPDAMWALSKATICLSTKFMRLTKLKANICFCYSSLQDFIQCADSLEVLTVKQRFGKGVPKWTVPVEVPRCLSNSLKVVDIKSYRGNDNEHEMIGYMLKHGSALEVIQLTSSLWDMEEVNFELIKKIRSFPRKSPACKVELLGNNSA